MTAATRHPLAPVFTPAASLDAHGSVIALLSCRVCGAAVLLDPRDRVDAPDLHVQWHRFHGEDDVIDALLDGGGVHAQPVRAD